MRTEDFIADRARSVKESGIRRIFNLAATLKNPIDFSIGQPDYDVPDPVKEATIEAIRAGHNGYTVTAGLPTLREKIAAKLGNLQPESHATLVCSGVSGGLLLALMATLNPGEEVLYPDPYFVSYPNLVGWLGSTTIPVSTYPDFHLRPERFNEAVSAQTKALIVNSPNNPTGIVYRAEDMENVCQIARAHNLLIISDEIYADLSFDQQAPSPMQYAPERTIMIRGFGKSYGMTGWRMGYVVAPQPLVSQMANMQQYTFVCAPSMAQHGALAALDTDIASQVERYRQKRNLVEAELRGHYEFARPSGGFYFFLKTPPNYAGGTEFVEKALERNLLCVPGSVFSRQDTHFRISYAVPDDTIRQGCEVLRQMSRCG